MTISHPHPQHANMEVQEDIERVARWLGTIVAPGYFNAFYHKPSVSTTFHVLGEAFSPLARSVLEPAIAAMHISVAGLAPVYLDRHPMLMPRIIHFLFSGTEHGHHRSLKVRTGPPVFFILSAH